MLQVEQRELAKTIRVSGSILLSTVSNFLDFFKTEAGKQLDVVCTDVEVQVHHIKSFHPWTCQAASRPLHLCPKPDHESFKYVRDVQSCL